MNAAEWMGSCLGYMFAAWICVSIMLPIRLKFDSEKSRYANLIMIAVVFIAEFLISSAIDYLPVRIVEAGKEWLYGLSAGGVLGLSLIHISFFCFRPIGHPHDSAAAQHTALTVAALADRLAV